MLKHSFLNPPAYVVEDESVIYRRALRRNIQRQEERDMMAMALLDNELHGKEYVSVFETHPHFMDDMPEDVKASIKAQLVEIAKKRPIFDASKDKAIDVHLND